MTTRPHSPDAARGIAQREFPRFERTSCWSLFLPNSAPTRGKVAGERRKVKQQQHRFGKPEACRHVRKLEACATTPALPCISGIWRQVKPVRLTSKKGHVGKAGHKSKTKGYLWLSTIHLI